MGNFFRIIAIASALAILILPVSFAAQDLPVVSSADQVKAPDMRCEQNGEKKTAFKLKINGIARTTKQFANRSYSSIELAEGEKLTVGSTSQVGYPDLPLYSTTIAIPDYVGMRARINSSSYVILEDYEIAPSQKPLIEGQQPGPDRFSINQAAYNSNSFYPENLVTIGDPAIMRDFRMAMITVAPVQYNPVTKQLRVYTDIDFDIIYEGSNPINPAPLRRDYISEAFRPLYKSLFANFDQVCGDIPAKRGGYLIITHDHFLDSLDDFAAWKHQKGYHVKVTPLSEIGTNPSAYQIDTYIDTACTNWEYPPEYVLLIGDVSMPFGNFPDYSYSYYTSDHKYGCLDNNSDWIPDIFVSRWAIDSDQELHWVMRKSLRYEQDPAELGDGWVRRGLSVAGNIYAETPRLTVLWVRQKLIDNTYTRVDTCFDWSGGGHTQCNENVIRNAMNDGVNIIAYRGWAYSSGWANPSFTVSNLNALTNGWRGGVMTSIVCGTGNYGGSTDPCFGEAWIRGGSQTSPRCGVTFFGTTDGSTHTQWNNPIMVGFYWGLFDQDLTHFCQSVVRGKMHQYETFPSHVQPGGNIEKYFHTYNPLGDPELNVWRTTPTYMIVEHPENVTIDNNYITVRIMDSERLPVEGAYVTALKTTAAEDEIFSVGKTDENGYLLLPFNANPTTGIMLLTITHPDFIPYRTSFNITTSDIAIGYVSHTIDDDNNGYSHGNGDGEANPAEYIELDITVYNGGTSTARNVSGVLSIDDPYGRVLSGTSNFGNVPPEAARRSQSKYVVLVSKDCPSGYMLPFELTLTADGGGEWKSLAEIAVSAPELQVTQITIDDATGNNNGRLDPGETAELTIDLQNNGTGDVLEFGAVLTSDEPYIELEDTIGFFGNIPTGQTGNNSANTYEISADSDIIRGNVCKFLIKGKGSTGLMTSIPFDIEVGQKTSVDPVGPDKYGYYMYDDTDIEYSECPSYGYIDVSGTGTRIARGDDLAELVSIPINFIHYGQAYEQITICSNGFIATDIVPYDEGGTYWALFLNCSIPDPGNAGGQISPFWDDLNGSIGTGIFYYYDSDNHRFIIDWHNIQTKWLSNNTYETFEMIIYDASYYPTVTGDSKILFQYYDINDNDYDENYSSVGFESHDEHDGLEYVFCRNYNDGAATLADGRAIMITTNTGRGRITGTATLPDNPDNSGITAITDTGQKGYTAANGRYSVDYVETGSVNIAFIKKGYFPYIMNGVDVEQNRISQVNSVELEPAPAPLDFTADGEELDIVLSWGEPQASVTGYNVYRDDFEKGFFTKLNETLITDTFFVDTDVVENEVYWYYAEAVYENATSRASDIDSSKLVRTGAGDPSSALPREYSLSQNYPNPFNPTTAIQYALPRDSRVDLSVYNVMGQRVATLVDEIQKAGYKAVTWDGRNDNGDKVASGIYFYRLHAGDYSKARRMIFLK